MHDWNTTTINGAVQTRTHGPAHELLTMSGAQVTNSPRTLTYDTKGNMTTDDRGCGMAWDFDNMLLSFAANGVTDLKNATYEYDAIGRRVAKNVAETGGTQTTVFVQAGQQVTCEYTPGNATTDCDRKYAYGSYIDEVLNFVDATAAEVRYWLSQNRQYSVHTTSDSQAVVAQRLYYSGNGERNLIGLEREIAFAFTGRPVDRDSNLLHFRSRQFAPTLARFLSRDQESYIDGMNVYFGYFLTKDLDPSGNSSYPCTCSCTKMLSGNTNTTTSEVEAASLAEADIKCTRKCSRMSHNDRLTEPQNCQMVLPTNGSEPVYDPDIWNDTFEILGLAFEGDYQCSNNCYDYAVDAHEPGGPSDHNNPGGKDIPRSKITCAGITALLIADGASPVSCSSACPSGKSKIYLVVKPGEDYHFYRQDKDGWWSHKPGYGCVTNIDNKGDLIRNPVIAVDDYPDRCGCFCK